MTTLNVVLPVSTMWMSCLQYLQARQSMLFRARLGRTHSSQHPSRLDICLEPLPIASCERPGGCVCHLGQSNTLTLRVLDSPSMVLDHHLWLCSPDRASSVQPQCLRHPHCTSEPALRRHSVSKTRSVNVSSFKRLLGVLAYTADWLQAVTSAATVRTTWSRSRLFMMPL
jgi:hypothetical protein